MFKNLSYVSIAYVFIYVGGYLFHFIISRKLGPVDYGKFIVLNSLFLSVGNIAGILTTVSVKSLIDNNIKISVLNYLRLIAFILGFVFFSLGFFLSEEISRFINIDQKLYIFLISLSWLFVFNVAVERGYLQATGNFKIYSFSIIFELFLKFCISLFLLFIGYKVFGIFVGLFLSILVTIIYLLYKNKNLNREIQIITLRKIIQISFYAAPVGLFIYVDDLFLRRIFEPQIAGIFGSVSIIGKAFIGFCLILMSVFFPEFVKSKHYKDLNKLLVKYFFVVLGVFVATELVVFLFGKQLFLILFGKEFITGFEFLPVYILAVLPLVLSIIFMNLFVAVERGLVLIYMHLILYFTGFLILPITQVYHFIGYIFFINLMFLVFYGMFYLKFKADFADKK